MTTDSDQVEQLLVKASRGDLAAREQLLHEHRDRLRRMVAVRIDRRLTGRIDASDVVQEALVDANRELDGYLRCPEIPFYPWLRRFVWDRLFKLHRFHVQARRSVEREAGAGLPLPDSSARDLVERIAGNGTSPSRRLIREELRAGVRQALDAMAAPDRAEILRRIAEKEPAPLRKLNPSVPLDLETIVRKATEKEPSQRYSTAAELAADLRRFLEARPIAARRVSPAERLMRWGLRNPWVAGLSGLLILCLVALAFGATVAAFRFREARDQLEAAPTGRRLAAGGEDGAVVFWDADQWIPSPGEEPVTLVGHGGPIYAVEFSPDGRRVGTASGDKSGRIWDAATGKELRRFVGNKKPVFCIAFHPGGRWVALSSDRQADDLMGEVQVWDPVSGDELPLPVREPQEVFRLAFSPDGRLLASGGDDGAVRLWDVVGERELKKFRGHTGIVTGMAFNPAGIRLVSGSGDCTAKVWDVSS